MKARKLYKSRQTDKIRAFAREECINIRREVEDVVRNRVVMADDNETYLK